MGVMVRSLGRNAPYKIGDRTARAPFRESLEQLNQEFAEYLATKYVPKTARKHTGMPIQQPSAIAKIIQRSTS
ncbi:MAG: hypothetical protein HC936_00390 [Leptolyngbyaceae cyanobacterium SU_3_3]|nr:hypothetical protein [Leptolyngbyaceae cyanobacterium SU_3_3]NJR53104.1 hypothetical protein [Leptolyngbyaceae cyanobacterium CSU_1_3]